MRRCATKFSEETCECPEGAKPPRASVIVYRPPSLGNRIEFVQVEFFGCTLVSCTGFFGCKHHHTKFTKTITKTRKPIRLGYRQIYVVPSPVPQHKKAQIRKPSVCSAKVGRFQRPTRQRNARKGGQGWRNGKKSSANIRKCMVGFSLASTLTSHLLFKLFLTPPILFLIWGAGPRLRRGVSYFLGPYTLRASQRLACRLKRAKPAWAFKVVRQE